MKCCIVIRLGCAVLQVYAAVAYALLDENCVARADDKVFGGHNSTYQSLVCEWLGIPYAQAPIGDLRFATPVKPLSSSGIFDAASYVSRPSDTIQAQDGSDRFPLPGLRLPPNTI